MLPFGGAVANFTLPSDPQGVLESVVRFALVQANLGAALHVDIEQPFDDEQRPFDAPG